MGSFIKTFFQRMKQLFSGLLSALRIVALFATLTTFLGFASVVYGFIKNFMFLILGGSAILLSSIVILIAVYTAIEPIFRQTSYTSEYYGFEVIEKNLIYKYFEDGKTMEHIRIYKLKALQTGLTSFTDRYTWTGTGKCDLSILEPGYTVSIKKRIDSWNYFDINFARPTKQGEVIILTIHWDLFDKDGTSVPVLSTLIDRPTLRTILRVILPTNQRPKQVLFFDYPNTITWMPKNVSEGNYDPLTGEIRFDVTKPEYQHKYMISWS